MADSTPVKTIYELLAPLTHLCLLCCKGCSKKYNVIDKFGKRGSGYDLAVYFFGKDFANVNSNYGIFICQLCHGKLSTMKKRELAIVELKESFRRTSQALVVNKNTKRFISTPLSNKLIKFMAHETNSGNKIRIACQNSSHEESVGQKTAKVRLDFQGQFNFVLI